MKKNFILSVAFCLMSVFAFAADNKSGVTVDIKVETTNVSESEAKWLVPAVTQKLESNISKYTDYSIIVNSAKQKEIFREQTKWVDDNSFEQDEELEIGTLKNASHRFNVSILKLPEGYQVSVDLTYMVKGVKKATATSTKGSVQELYSQNGSAIDEITISLCEQLGIPLSSTEQTFMKYGEVKLTEEEKKEIYAADEKYYTDMIEEMNKEIQAWSTSTDMDAGIKQKQIEADKALAEEKLKVAQENQRRVAEEAELRKQYEQENASRDAAVTSMIESMAKEATAKAQDIRNTKIESQSLIGQIQVIELKKKAVLEIYNKVESEKEAINNKAAADIAKKKEEIYDIESYKPAELVNGTPSEQALNVRNFRFQSAETEINENRDKDIAQIEANLNSQIESLLKEIDDNLRSLQMKKISTLDNELVVSYGAYNHEKFGWELSLIVKSDGLVLFQTSSFITYQQVTGKQPVVEVTTPEQYKAYEAYIAEIDMYNSLFLRREPIFIFELEYTVTPMTMDKPSQYNFSFMNFKYYDMKTLERTTEGLSSKNTGKLDLTESNHVKQMSPVHNMTPLKPFTELITFNKARLFPVEEFEAASGSSPDSRYYLFGVWPQSLKEDSVTVSETPESVNSWACYKGSDGWYYVKAKAAPYETSYSFSNGTKIIPDTEYYFKLEPIQWRVLTDSFNGGQLLLSEKILYGAPYSTAKSNSYNESSLTASLNADFLYKAFPPESQELLVTVTVDNSQESAGDAGNNIETAEVSASDNTANKAFLLSEREATTEAYGFGTYKEESATRLKYVTDYGKAAGAYVSTRQKTMDAGWWWLRSPMHYFTVSDRVRTVGLKGTAYDYNQADNTSGGVVPAIVISK